MSDKDALQEVVYMVNDYVNGNTGYYKSNEFIEDLTRTKHLPRCSMQ